MTTLARLIRGLVASAVLLALLVGVPAVLAAAVGWPLPRSVPAWHNVTSTFSGDARLDPDTVWKVLACVVWIAWAQILVATAIEIAAIARGGVALPIRGLGHVQGLTGPLLGAAALLLPGSLTPAGGKAVIPPVSAARTLVAHVEAPAMPPPTGPDASPAPAPPTFIEHTVVRRDTLWDLAHRYLAPGGTPDEIASAVEQLFDLNAGRPQPDGAALTDASLLRTGWVLRIPVSAPAGPENVTVEPGDSLWEIAEEHLEDGSRYQEVFDLNAGRPQPDGRSLTEPSLIRPGWNLELPGATAAPPSPSQSPPVTLVAPPPAPDEPETHSPTPSTTTSTVTDASPPEQSAPAARDDDNKEPVGALGIAAGFLAAGLGTAIATRRRRRRIERSPGTELPPLPADAEPVLDAIADADIDVSIAIDHALRELGQALVDRESTPVPIVGTLDGPNFELLLDRDDPNPPEGWTAVAGGRIWSTELQIHDDCDGGPAWLPTFVSIGARDLGGLLLNLEAVGAVGIVGDPDAAAALTRSIAVELGVTPLADLPAVHVVGCAVGADLPATLPGISHHDELASALAAVESQVAATASSLADSGAETVFALRCRVPEEAWQPAVVVVAAAESYPEELERLVARCRERTGVAAVILGECPADAIEVAVTEEAVEVRALGLRSAPQLLDFTSFEGIGDLLDAADAPCTPPEEAGPLTLFPATEYGAMDGPEPKLRLRLLGPIAAEGAELRPQQLAVVAYLTLHPEATADALRDAVWGGRAPTRERFLNTIHELRRAVGSDVLPPSTDGRYRLHHVWCDLAEVERLVASASAHPENATADLRAALELVVGPPLTYESRHRRHFRWVDLGNHASRWERIVGDAAHDLASIALGNDDVDLARWAAERGLVASPANETLTCDLVAAHLAAGDRNAAEQVVEAYARVLEDLGVDEPPEAMQELIERRRAS
jgi:DNA-binding SARP family transcriptional activator